MMLDLRALTGTSCIVAAGIALAAGGCIDDPALDGYDEEESIGSTGQASVVIDNSIILDNGLDMPNGGQLTARLDLGNGNQSSIGYNLPGNTINPSGTLKTWLDSSPTNHSKIVKYLIQCALSSGTNISFTYGGSTTTYSGLLGFGTGLKNGAMSTAEEERVSACLLIRMNQLGASITFNMVGPSTFGYSGINTRTSTDNSNYPYPEASFGGNIFLDPPQAFMCGAGAFSSNAPLLCTSRACDGNCTIGSSTSSGTYGSCGIVEYVSDCYLNCTVSWARNAGDDPYFYNCTDSAHNTTWAYMMSSYIKRYGSTEPCLGDWECLSESCNMQSYTCN